MCEMFYVLYLQVVGGYFHFLLWRFINPGVDFMVFPFSFFFFVILFYFFFYIFQISIFSASQERYTTRTITRDDGIGCRISRSGPPM